MASTRLSHVGEAAIRELIARYDLHHRMALPVPIVQVARDEGWTIVYSDRLAPLYAYALVYGDVRMMRVNAAVVPAYQRAAIAHEMAHVLNGDVSLLRFCAMPPNELIGHWVTRRMERQAQLGAARLLIPPWALTEFGTIAEVAAACDVPTELVELLVSSR